MLYRSCLVSLIATAGLVGNAQASMFNVTGSWSVTLNGQGYTNEPFTGTAAFTYSDDTISGVGLEHVEGSLTAFSLSPNPLGATTQDLSNTGFYVVYNDGSLYQIIVGSTANTVTSVAQNTDDFYVNDFVHSNEVIAVSTAAYPTTAVLLSSPSTPDLSVNFTVSPVPEPASGLLLALAGCAAAMHWLRKRKSR